MNADKRKPAPLQWWGYRHTSGTIQLKRFFSDRDLDEAYESPFCKTVVDPFPAASREEAAEKLKQAIEKAEGRS